MYINIIQSIALGDINYIYKGINFILQIDKTKLKTCSVNKILFEIINVLILYNFKKTFGLGQWFWKSQCFKQFKNNEEWALNNFSIYISLS